MMRLTKKRSDFKLSWPLAPILMLTLCAQGFASGSMPQASPQRPTVQALDELARAVDRLQLEVESLKRKLALKDEQHTNDLEAVRLRGEKISLLDAQLVDAKAVIVELKLAGTADANQIKALKDELKIADKEIRALKFQNFLTGRLGFLLLIVAFIGGVYAGSH